MTVHRVSPFGWEYCDAGFSAFFSGRWDGMAPCENKGFHLVMDLDASNDMEVLLCEEHFRQVHAAGLVEHVNPKWKPDEA